MSAPLIAALGKLLQAPETGLPGSGLTPAQRQALETFARRTHCVSQTPRGRGVVYRVSDLQQLQGHWRTLCPVVQEKLPENLPSRAANIARQRSSKKGPARHPHYYLLLKAIDDQARWHRGTDLTLNLSQATTDYGVASIQLTADDDWCTPEPLWLVENQALFDRLDWLPPTSRGSIAYYAGHLNHCLLDWLACQPRASRIILFADYDGVGLLNYLRLRERSAADCQFWLMPRWQDRLKRYGDNRLWQKTLPEFLAAAPPLMNAQEPPAFHTLINTLQSLGLALEQEAVWLD